MKKWHYAFDNDGYYLGLAYPIDTDKVTGLPIYATHTTDQEPYWKDGFLPRWDFTIKNWTLEPREEKHHRLAVEKEIISKLEKKIDERFQEIHASLANIADIQVLVSRSIETLDRNMADRQNNNAQKTLILYSKTNEQMLKIQSMIETYERFLNQKLIDSLRYLSPIRSFIQRIIGKILG